MSEVQSWLLCLAVGSGAVPPLGSVAGRGNACWLPARRGCGARADQVAAGQAGRCKLPGARCARGRFPTQSRRRRRPRPSCVRGGMAAASRARGWAPRPLLLLPLLLGPLVPAGCAAAARLSLHPPYFNLAEAARIWATATCGKREAGSARPRPELYCKLVGGPPAPGSGHPIQVRTRESARAAGGGRPPRATTHPRPRDEGTGPLPKRACDPRRPGRAPQSLRGPAAPGVTLREPRPYPHARGGDARSARSG